MSACEAPACEVCYEPMPPAAERVRLRCGRAAGRPRGHGDRLCPGCLLRVRTCPLCREPLGDVPARAVRALADRRLEEARAALRDRGWLAPSGRARPAGAIAAFFRQVPELPPAPAGPGGAPPLRARPGGWEAIGRDRAGGVDAFLALADQLASAQEAAALARDA